MVKCNCWSVGLNTETCEETKMDRPDILKPSDYFKESELEWSIAVDHCISPVIKELWKAGIWTENSCCGHNGGFCEGNPSIVFANPLSDKEVENIRKIISEVDDRKFILFAWKLTEF